jgi:Cu/Ag efflux protein CusF
MIRLPKWLLVALALVVLAALATPALAAEEVKGKIKTLTADKKEFVLTDENGKDMEFTVTEDAKLRLGDKDIKLNELKEGDQVTVMFEKKEGKLMATEVRCRRE